ncbi:hypothetical protein MM5_130 [Morganella phage vB_Mm5]
MKKLLLIWQVIPEETQLRIVDVTDDEIEIVKHAHGKYINASETDELSERALEYINIALSNKFDPDDESSDIDKIYAESFNIPLEVFGKWKDAKSADSMIDVKAMDIDYVIESGFYL